MLTLSRQRPGTCSKLLSIYGCLAAWLQPDAGHALEEHLYVVDPMGEWMMRVPAQPDPAKVKRDLERLLRVSAGWDRAGR